MTRRGWRALLTVAIGVLPACSPDAPTATTSPDLATASSILTRVADELRRDSVEERARLSGLPGRLLVVDEDGRLLVMRPDGSEEIVLGPANPGAVQTRPTWSPDGSRVAWTETTDERDAFVVVAAADGSGMTSSDAPFAAGHLAWAPTGDRIAFSGNGPDGRLRLAEGETGREPRVIDEGAPLYFDWDDAGRGLLVHVGGRFEYVPVDGGDRTPVDDAGRFRVGLHLGDRVVFSVAGSEGEVLTVAQADGNTRRGLVRYGTPAAYVLHPDEDRVALLGRSTETVASADGDLPTLAPDRLFVVRLDDGRISPVSDERALAWVWAPQRDRLLYGVRPAEGPPLLRWQVWDGVETSTYAEFVPSGTFGSEYLAFFDQVDRSVSYWSPDGSAFAYAGDTGDGVDDVWVQTVDGAPPVRMAAGVLAIWSPTG